MMLETTEKLPKKLPNINSAKIENPKSPPINFVPAERYSETFDKICILLVFFLDLLSRDHNKV